MNRGVRKGVRHTSDERSFAEKSEAAFDGGVPEWVAELASYADTYGLRAAGEIIGYSYAVVSTVITGKYNGDLSMVAEKVGGALMGITVECPGAGMSMSRKVCLDWQKKPWAPNSSQRTKMFLACPKCPNFRKKGGNHAK